MEKQKTSFFHIFTYSLGDGAYCLSMNTIYGFAMLFYTQALGIAAEKTALILAIPMLWDAVTDPAMGYFTDHTRSRFGRFHPHLLIGGVLLALCYSFLWNVPDMFQSSESTMIAYLIVLNLIIRTLLTWFYVPYIALGFGVCPDYDQQSKLQGMRFVVNMAFNAVFCGVIIWRMFPENEQGLPDTTVQETYAQIGLSFSVLILLLILLTVFFSRKFIVDSRELKVSNTSGFKSFFVEMLEIFKDRNSQSIFLFYSILQCSCVFVASVQMYVYISFMEFKAYEASRVHFTGMILFGIGSFLAGYISKKIDKKPTIYVGAGISVLANAALAVIFLTGIITPQMMPVGDTSLASLVFSFLQASYWMGIGIVCPMTFSIIADVSEINRIKTGQEKEGSYSAILTFLIKATGAIAMIGVGKVLVFSGFVEGVDRQSAEVSYNLMQVMVFLGICFTVAGAVCIIKYPINREFMEKIRKTI